MSSQNYMFKEIPSKDFLFHILEKISDKVEGNIYMLDKNAFKRLLLFELQHHFLTEIERCYYYSKKYYAQRKLTYSSFTRMIVQLCKLHNVPFTIQKHYEGSQTINTYFINYLCESNG